MSKKRKSKLQWKPTKPSPAEELIARLRGSVDERNNLEAERDAALQRLATQQAQFRAELDKVVAAFSETLGAIRKAYDVR